MKRLCSVLCVIAGSASIIMCCDMFRCLGVASAAQLAVTADPVSAVPTSIDNGWSLVTTYGPIWGGMALAFGLAAWLLKRNESTHWIAQGRVLAIIVTVVGTGTAILSAHFAGTAWSGVLITGVLSLFKLMQPVVNQPPAAPPVSHDTAPVVTGSATTVALLIAVASVLNQGCATSTRDSSIKTAMIAIEATDKAFVSYDSMELSSIVAKATSQEDGKARLAVYRKKQGEVVKALIAAYTAIGVAAQLNDDHSLASMAEAIKTVVAAVQSITKVTP